MLYDVINVITEHPGNRSPQILLNLASFLTNPFGCPRPAEENIKDESLFLFLRRKSIF
jgi:hypothetical protein